MKRVTKPETVVLIHGIWMNGLDMSLLNYRLRRCGLQTLQFSYPTIRYSLKQNADRLQRFVEAIDSEVIHFVAHSMGGLLVRQFFHDHPDQRPGRVVTLGTPHLGSQVARRMGRNPFGKAMLGQSFKNGLRGDVPPWDGERDLAVIAGNISLGVGRLVSRLPKPNDGTVTVDETRLPTACAHIVLPVSHASMLLSREVADITCHFLQTGYCD